MIWALSGAMFCCGLYCLLERREGVEGEALLVRSCCLIGRPRLVSGGPGPGGFGGIQDAAGLTGWDARGPGACGLRGRAQIRRQGEGRRRSRLPELVGDLTLWFEQRHLDRHGIPVLRCQVPLSRHWLAPKAQDDRLRRALVAHTERWGLSTRGRSRRLLPHAMLSVGARSSRVARAPGPTTKLMDFPTGKALDNMWMNQIDSVHFFPWSSRPQSQEDDASVSSLHRGRETMPLARLPPAI